jgi:hypothetical protein
MAYGLDRVHENEEEIELKIGSMPKSVNITQRKVVDIKPKENIKVVLIKQNPSFTEE